MCQFPNNVLNEGSEHLEVYELEKSISHLTSHLIIITAVIFFLLWQVTWAHFSIFICAWQFVTQWDKILSEGAFHATVFFDDIYETYHDSSGISRQQTLNSHRLPKDCLKKYLTFVTKLKKCLIKTKNAPFKIFLTHCSVPFLLAKFAFCHASRRLWASYMSLKCICSGSVLIKYLTKLFQIGMWKWKHPLFIAFLEIATISLPSLIKSDWKYVHQS